VSVVPEVTLPDLVAELVALRHAGGYRFKIQQRVLRQFADHCRRQGYPDGSITKEAVDGFLYGRHLRSSTVRRNELALRQLADDARPGRGRQSFELVERNAEGLLMWKQDSDKNRRLAGDAVNSVHFSHVL